MYSVEIAKDRVIVAIPHPSFRMVPFSMTLKGEGKVKGLDTCYSDAYMSQTRDQQRFTLSEVAADWHEPVVPQRIMWPSIARAKPQSATHGLHPVAVATTHFTSC